MAVVGTLGISWDFYSTDQEEDYHLKIASAIYETKC